MNGGFEPFLHGALFAGFGVVGTFFLRFWSRTRDRFFLLFATAFYTFGMDEIAFVAFVSADPSKLYALRLLGFVLLLLAIVDKNRSH